MDYKSFVNTDTRSIYINGEITTSEISYICFNLLHMLEEDDYNDLNIKDYVREPIKIYITSPGGEVDPSFGLIDIILNSKTPIYTYCVGYAHSMGLKIFLAGEKRFVYRHSTFAYHQLSSGYIGKYEDIVDYANLYEDIQTTIEEYVLERTNIEREKLIEVRKHKTDWFISAKEAIVLGIATDILE